MKKFFSLLLASMLVVGLMPSLALATPSDSASTDTAPDTGTTFEPDESESPLRDDAPPAPTEDGKASIDKVPAAEPESPVRENTQPDGDLSEETPPDEPSEENPVADPSKDAPADEDPATESAFETPAEDPGLDMEARSFAFDGTPAKTCKVAETVYVRLTGPVASATSSNPRVIGIVDADGYGISYMGKEAGTSTLTITSANGAKLTLSVSATLSLYDRGYAQRTFSTSRLDKSMHVPVFDSIEYHNGYVGASYLGTFKTDNPYGYEMYLSKDANFSKSLYATHEDSEWNQGGYAQLSIFNVYFPPGTKFYYKVRSYRFDGNTYVYGPWTATRTFSACDEKTASNRAARYNYELYLLDADTVGASIYSGVRRTVYVKTNNPDPNTFKITTPDGGSFDGNTSTSMHYDDVKFSCKGDVDAYARKVDGGYLCDIQPDAAGMQTIQVREFGADGYSIAHSYRVNVVDYSTAATTWWESVIAAHTTPSMTRLQKFNAVCAYLRTEEAGFKYFTNTVKDGETVLLRLVTTPNSPYFAAHRWNSYVSPAALCTLASLLGYAEDEYYNCYSGFPAGEDGWNWTNCHYLCGVRDNGAWSYDWVCPYTPSGQMDAVQTVNFANTASFHRLDAVDTPISKATIAAMPSQTYTGNAISPNPRVSLDGKTLVLDNDYTLAYKSNVNVGIATITITGKGMYSGVVTTTFSITKAPIGSASVSTPPAQTYTGKARKPKPKVSYGGKTLKEGVDYTLSYKNNVAVGTATVTVVGKGNYAGTKAVAFKIVKKTAPTTITRLAGDTALETMNEIVGHGWSAGTGGTVVLATSGGYWDALTAAGLAGMVNAPVLLTDGASLSLEAARELARLKPSTLVVCGGSAAVSDGVANAACKKAGGAKLVRCHGATATDTAAQIALKAPGVTGGSWSNTAFIATNAGYWDALSIAPYAYAKHCPIFLTEGADSVSNGTIAAMKKLGIENFYLCGGKAAISDKVRSQLTRAGFRFADRFAGDTAVDTSRIIAQFELKEGMSADKMAVATNGGYWDALCGAALCGKNNAVLVLASDDERGGMKQVARDNKKSIARAYLFGGTSAVSNGTRQALVDALA